MDFSILKAELTGDPLGRNYSEMSAQQAADSLNAVDVATRKLVPLWAVKKSAIESGCWLAIKAAALSHATPQVQGAAMIAVDYIDDQRFQNLDMDLESTQGMIAALVVGGVITQAQADALDELADESVSRASQLGLPRVGPHHIEYARAV